MWRNHDSRGSYSLSIYSIDMDLIVGAKIKQHEYKCVFHLLFSINYYNMFRFSVLIKSFIAFCLYFLFVTYGNTIYSFIRIRDKKILLFQ